MPDAKYCSQIINWLVNYCKAFAVIKAARAVSIFTVVIMMQQVIALLLVVYRAQAFVFPMPRSSVEEKCECLEFEEEGQRRIGNCTLGSTAEESVQSVVDLKVPTELFDLRGTEEEEINQMGESYLCRVDAGSSCPDKRLIPGTKDQYTSHQACQYFVPKPVDFPEKVGETQGGCGPEGVDFPWKAFNGSCYLLVKEKASWEEARRLCSDHLVLS